MLTILSASTPQTPNVVALGRSLEMDRKQGHVFSVDVSGNMRLLFSPCETFAVKPDGGIDLSSVKAIGIREQG